MINVLYWAGEIISEFWSVETTSISWEAYDSVILLYFEPIVCKAECPSISSLTNKIAGTLKTV